MIYEICFKITQRECLDEKRLGMGWQLLGWLLDTWGSIMLYYFSCQSLWKFSEIFHNKVYLLNFVISRIISVYIPLSKYFIGCKPVPGMTIRLVNPSGLCFQSWVSDSLAPARVDVGSVHEIRKFQFNTLLRMKEEIFNQFVGKRQQVCMHVSGDIHPHCIN